MGGDSHRLSAKGPSCQEGPFCVLDQGNSGNVVFYIFMAIALMAALTYAVVNSSRDDATAQNAMQISESLYSQSNMIMSAIQQCVMEYPQGGGDLDQNSGVGVIDSDDNPNNPYPLNPSSALIDLAPAGCTTTNDATGCITQANGDDRVKNLACIGAPLGAAYMFQGVGNQGRFLPPHPPGFGEWNYGNDEDGVYIQIEGSGDSTAAQVLRRLMKKFSADQADTDACEGMCFTVWIKKNPAP